MELYVSYRASRAIITCSANASGGRIEGDKIAPPPKSYSACALMTMWLASRPFAFAYRIKVLILWPNFNWELESSFTNYSSESENKQNASYIRTSQWNQSKRSQRTWLHFHLRSSNASRASCRPRHGQTKRSPLLRAPQNRVGGLRHRDPQSAFAWSSSPNEKGELSYSPVTIETKTAC